MSALEFRLSSAQLGPGAFVVALGGEVDLHTAPRLDEELFRLIDLGAIRIVVDLSGANFVDSTILGVLVRASKRFAFLVLAVGDFRVLRVLEITGLDRKLRVERSREEALAALSARAAA